MASSEAASRLMAALASVYALDGVGITVADVVARAGVSRRTFYEHFDGIEDCLLRTIDDGHARAVEAIVQDWAACVEATWLVRLRAALLVLVQMIEREPDLAILCLEMDGLGLAARQRVAQRSYVLCRFLDQGRVGAPPLDPPSRTAEFVMGGAMVLVHNLLVYSDVGRLHLMYGPLLELITLPYRGTVVAASEGQREIGAAETAKPYVLPGRSLSVVALRVLRAISQETGQSNAWVAARAGVADQGQVSRLLKRLEGEGLVCNLASGAGRGAPNAWRISKTGEYALEVGA